MDKAHIIDEIKRTAADNDGQPLGVNRFRTVTGIRRTDWDGKYWARWGDALKEAGFTPNSKKTAFDETLMIEQLIEFIHELGRYPVPAEFKMRSRGNPMFPGYDAVIRVGRKHELATRMCCLLFLA